MKLKFTLVAERIVKNNAVPVSIFPPNTETPLGVGRSFGGKFVTPPGSLITAYQEYTQTATGIDQINGAPATVSLGESVLHVSTECDTIVLYFSFELVTLNPAIPFTVGPVTGQVLSARLNGKPVDASVRFRTPDGGLTGVVTVCI